MSKFKIAFLSSLITLVFISIAFAAFVYKNNQDAVPVVINETGKNYAPDELSVITTSSKRESLNNDIDKSRSNIITRTVKTVSPAVVGINVKEIRQYRSPFSNDPFFKYFFEDRVYSRELNSAGSGSIISPDGYIITNDHVAGRASKIIVTMTDGTSHKATIVGTDQVSDICLLKIDASDLPYIKFGNSDDVLIGEWAIALGNPFGLFDINDKPTVTVGVVSALGMNLGVSDQRYYLDMIQTDAAINAGNSGGALVNSAGEMIGMNTLIWTASGSSGNVGVGFAIPINKIKKIISELKSNKTINRDFWTGLRGQTIDEGLAKYYSLSNTHGVIITYVQPKSPSDKAGIKEGDIILRVGKYKITNFETLAGVFQEYRPGETVKLEIQRDSKKLNKQITLAKK